LLDGQLNPSQELLPVREAGALPSQGNVDIYY
jgi:hypothetical protein